MANWQTIIDAVYVENRARMYARHYSKTHDSRCLECGKVPLPAPVFTEKMSCGHAWTALAWVPR